MVPKSEQRIAARALLVAASAVMFLVAIYTGFVFLLEAVLSGVGPLSVFDVAYLMSAPAYLVSAATAWRWPWVAESVAVLTLVVIFSRFHPWTVSPFRRAFFLDYAFVVAANVAFFSWLWLRCVEANHT